MRIRRWDIVHTIVTKLKECGTQDPEELVRWKLADAWVEGFGDMSQRERIEHLMEAKPVTIEDVADDITDRLEDGDSEQEVIDSYVGWVPEEK